MKIRIISLLFVIVLTAFFVFSPPSRCLASQGCCSWHGGESGRCSNGSEVCNDGTLSPTCGCYSAPALKTYSWHFQTYYSYSNYYQARWDDIQKMYHELLGRPFNSQTEGKIFTDQTDKDYYTIYSEISASDEHKQYLAKQTAKTSANYQAKSSPVAEKPAQSSFWSKLGYTFLFIIGGGWIILAFVWVGIYSLYKKIAEWLNK